MAGGIDWFRWHHGSVNDPKFRLVAKRANAKVCEVLALWAALLEAASAADDRGNPGPLDCEATDLALDFDDGTTARIYQHMRERDIIAGDGRLTAWDRRQPKRERPDDSSAERVRAHRAKLNQTSERNANESRVTPSNASDNQETPRVEESRGEESRGDLKASETTSQPVVEKPINGHPAASKFPNCPQQRIVALYGEKVPTAIQPKKWDGAEATALTARWRDTCKRLAFTDEAQGLEWFGTFFEVIAASDFLMGRTQSQGRQPFKLRLQWALKKENFDKIVEGVYS